MPSAAKKIAQAIMKASQKAFNAYFGAIRRVPSSLLTSLTSQIIRHHYTTYIILVDTAVRQLKRFYNAFPSTSLFYSAIIHPMAFNPASDEPLSKNCCDLDCIYCVIICKENRGGIIVRGFFAMLSRMKHISRWGLMRCSRRETLSEHTLEVAMLTHALIEIGNRRLGRSLDAGKGVLLALYHDCTEIITGDLPTPVKYHDPAIRDSYKAIEYQAAGRLLAMLPDDLAQGFSPYIGEDTHPDVPALHQSGRQAFGPDQMCGGASKRQP
jgi:hypothetical protein